MVHGADQPRRLGQALSPQHVVINLPKNTMACVLLRGQPDGATWVSGYAPGTEGGFSRPRARMFSISTITENAIAA